MAGLGAFEMNALGSYKVPNGDDSQVADYTPQTEETDFGGTESVDPGRGTARFRKRGRVYGTEETDFGGNTDSRDIEHNRLADLFRRVLDIPECDDTRFMDYLLDGRIISVARDVGHTDYLVTYSGDEYMSEGGVMADDTLRDGIRRHYDEWSKRLHREAVKRAGVIVGIGLSVAAIVTGLAVGLTRGGSDVIHAGKKRRKWEKLNPAKVSIPWSDIEEAGGDVLVFTGKYLTVILAVSAVYLTSRR